MSLRQRDVHVTSPCPIDLDETGMRGKGGQWHCGHCSKTVHVLSAMTESQARSFLAAHAGQDVCVSYAMSPAGEIRFRPEPVVPVASLVRRPRLAAAAAIGFGVAMAACAPHENPRVDAPPVVETLPRTASLPTIPAATAPVEDIQVDGGMRPRVPEDIQVEGGVKVPTNIVADAPCDPPTKPVTSPATIRGGLRPASR